MENTVLSSIMSRYFSTYADFISVDFAHSCVTLRVHRSATPLDVLCSFFLVRTKQYSIIVLLNKTTCLDHEIRLAPDVNVVIHTNVLHVYTPEQKYTIKFQGKVKMNVLMQKLGSKCDAIEEK